LPVARVGCASTWSTFDAESGVDVDGQELCFPSQPDWLALGSLAFICSLFRGSSFAVTTGDCAILSGAFKAIAIQVAWSFYVYPVVSPIQAARQTQ